MNSPFECPCKPCKTGEMLYPWIVHEGHWVVTLICNNFYIFAVLWQADKCYGLHEDRQYQQNLFGDAEIKARHFADAFNSRN